MTLMPDRPRVHRPLRVSGWLIVPPAAAAAVILLIAADPNRFLQLLVACVVIGAIALGVVLYQGTDIDVEWNPRSGASRAERAIRSGRLAEGLATNARAGRWDEIGAAIHREVAAPEVAAALIEAVGALRGLTDVARSLSGAWVPAQLSQRVAAAVDDTERQVWGTAATLASVHVHGSDPRLEAIQAQEAVRVAGLASAIRDTRAAIVELTLSGGAAGDGDRVEGTLRRLRRNADAVRSGITDEVLLG
jgi:hypothetical protein